MFKTFLNILGNSIVYRNNTVISCTRGIVLLMACSTMVIFSVIISTSITQIVIKALMKV